MTDRFVAERGEMIEAQCNACKHRRDGAKCVAFPQGIPKVILLNAIDHRKAFPGDHGIRFELKPGAESPYPYESSL